MMARDCLEGFEGNILVVFGDTPLVSSRSLARMIELRQSSAAPAIVVLGFRPAEPGDYGRLLVGADQALEGIVEARDATPDQARLTLCNSGVMAIDGRKLFGWLDRLGNSNAKGEYYLTDIIAVARADGFRCAYVEGPEEELLGINSRADLAAAEHVVQEQLRARAMAGGVTLIDPQSVFFSYDTVIGRDVVIEPFVVFAPRVRIGDNVLIRGFCHMLGVEIDNGAEIGPFARLRPGASIGPDVHVGNFVEIKNARIESGAKVNHLTYVGDARVGAGANVGAGTITCNYDGFFKEHTDIGAGAFIGSNTSLIAPVRIGDGAIIGAGSVIARDVPDDALALTRGPHAEKSHWAREFRARRKAEKAAKQSTNKS
jgi:bifunctional UDP-N-acetylglucosamine pyrophosphorylase/glucosamine-1-phosphate N-acetyltransferase